MIKNKEINLGEINQEKYRNILIDIPYTNSGKKELVIFKVDVSCNCISISYPQNPLRRGKVEYIKMSINPAKVKGYFHKNIFIKSNADNDVEIVHIKGFIK